MKHMFLLAVVLLSATPIGAQTMYRCTEGGKTSYSDRPCMIGNEVKRLAPDGGPTPEDVGRARMRARADQERPSAIPRWQPNSSPTAAPQSVAGSMSVDDVAKRTRELEVTLASTTIDKERRRAAQDELDRLRRGVAQQASAADQATLRDLRVGLSSTDQRKRAEAEAQQRAILDRYDTPEALEARRQAEAEAARKQAERRARNAAAAAATPGVITSCDGGGCWDSRGQRYNGSGPTMFRSDGKVCQHLGGSMQCN